MEIMCGFLHPYVFIGPEGALVEGIKRIYLWNGERIELTAGRRIIILGERLEIEYKSMDSVLIKGRISAISFAREKK
ncbi:MAG: YabP/YqfC family sporulation protein [Clostridia bacterium]|nr:YabP/YqfC family sporulation protein [Clostridia bacterium]